MSVIRPQESPGINVSDLPGDNQQVPGVSESIVEKIETPEEMLRRVLSPGEVVIAQFDCYFPKKVWPAWFVTLMIICTFGLILLYFLYLRIKNYFYRIGCCTPSNLDFVRRKMAVTSAGRIICWVEDYHQEKQKRSAIWLLCKCCCKKLCAAPSAYSYRMETSIYSMNKIRQISIVYESAAQAICCCLDYQAAVELAFNEFNHETSGGYLLTSFEGTFVERILQLFGFNKGTTVSILQIQRGFSWMGYSDNPNVLRIISTSADRQHNGAVHDVFNDIHALYSKVVATLPVLSEQFVKNGTPTGSLNIVEKYLDTKIVEDDRTINIPRAWLLMTPGEEILCYLGEVYRMNWIDWIGTLVTCGYHYCFPCDHSIHLKKKKRSAMILTNKRLITVDVVQKSGSIPSSLANMSFRMNSYLPGDIFGGYLSCKKIGFFRSKLESAISTAGGLITIQIAISDQGLQFCKAMHNVVTRANCPVQLELKSNPPISLEATDAKYIPIMPGEKVLSIAKSTPLWMTYWKKSIVLPICKILCIAPDADAVCSPEVTKCCFPYGIHLLSCGLRPFRGNQDLVVTNTSLISVISERNYGFLGCCGKAMGDRCSCCDSIGLCGSSCGRMCTTVGNISVTWVSVARFVGHNLKIQGGGVDNISTRLCKNNCLGRVFCPIDRSRYELSVFVETFSISVNGEKKNHNWLKDEDLLKVLNTLDQYQHILNAEEYRLCREENGHARSAHVVAKALPQNIERV